MADRLVDIIGGSGAPSNLPPPTLFAVLSGIPSTGAAGSLQASVSASLSGIPSTGAAGSLAVLPSGVILAGIPSTGAAGSFNAMTLTQLSGIPSTGAIGSLLSSRSAILSGIPSTGAIGSLIASSGTVVPDGIPSTAAPGSLLSSRSAVLGGIPSTATVGSLLASRSAVFGGIGTTMAMGSLTVQPAGFFVRSVVAIASNLIRVFFSEEPRYISVLSDKDVLNRLNYQISIVSAPVGVTAPVVEQIETVAPAPNLVLGGTPISGAWSVDVRIDRPVLLVAKYLLVANGSLVAYNNDPLDPDPFDRGTFYGIV